MRLFQSAQVNVRPVGSLPVLGGADSHWIRLNSEAVEMVRFIMKDKTASKGSLLVRFKKKEPKEPKEPNPGSKAKPSQQPSLVFEQPAENKLSSVYEYFDVPEVVFLGLLESQNAALFLNSRVKNQFSYKRWTNEEVEGQDSKEKGTSLVGVPTDIELPPGGTDLDFLASSNSMAKLGKKEFEILVG